MAGGGKTNAPRLREVMAVLGRYTIQMDQMDVSKTCFAPFGTWQEQDLIPPRRLLRINAHSH